MSVLTEAGVNTPPITPQPVAARRRRRVPLTLVLTGAFAGLVAVSIGVVLAVGFGANAQNTFSLLNKSTIVQLQMMEELITEDLDKTADTVNRLSDYLKIVDVTVDDPAFADILRGALLSNPRVEALIAYRRGMRKLGVARSPEGQLVTFNEEEPSSAMERERTSERLGNTVGEWGDVVLTRDTLWANYSITTQAGGEKILLVAAMSLQRISEITAEVAERFDGTTFILDGPNRVLAHSKVPRSPESTWAHRVSIPLVDFPDPVMAAYPRRERLKERFDDAAAQGVVVTKLTVEPGRGEEFIIMTRVVEGYGPRPWHIGVYYPGTQVSQEVHRLMMSGVTGLVALVVSILIAIWLGKRLAAPVLRVAEQSERIGRLDVDDIEPLPSSRLLEFDEEARAFNAMVVALRAFTTYVPRSLVNQLMSSQSGDPAISREAELTVMFTDIAGFTTISESLSAAASAKLLNDHLALLCREIAATSGTIDKFMGDGLMAFWGAPEPLRDHAARAASAALSIARALKDDNAHAHRDGRMPLQVRIGLHTGPVIVGNIGAYDRVNYTIIGDTVNVSSRLQTLGKDVGPKDEIIILVSGETAALLDERYVTKPVGGRRLRGRDAETTIYQLIDGPTAVLNTEPEAA
ncbi:MAG: adenylate/guanylate cyclase domain-containing protein [Hyphomicrobiales bacterium]|nr:adenylate/guanylate cyclase domain-containing protein [Hyphomicrobiales bacterium]